MNIEEYCDILNLNIRMTYYHNQNKRWSVSFDGAETKEDAGSSILKSEYGTGKTPELAMIDYLFLIRGRVLVINAMSGKDRRELVVPMELFVE